jgi:enamine deaminase RidA (YjgF/YER057c/UK114 family)
MLGRYGCRAHGMTKLNELYEIYPPERRATMPIAIRVDNWLFGSVSGVDPLTGVAAGDTPVQARAAIAAMKHVLVCGGMQAANVRSLRVVTSREDPRYFASLQEAFYPQSVEAPAYSRLPFSKWAALQVLTHPMELAPGQHVRIDFTATAGQGEWVARVKSPTWTAAPEAVKIGPVLWAHNVTATDPIDGSIRASGIEAQAEAAFDNLERLLEREGVRRSQLLRISGYMRDLKDKDVLNEAMVARFPEASERPVHKYVPAVLPPGIEFALQALAVDGADRRIVEMDGIKHNDPISLGAIAGNVFVSSRVQARLQPSAREQAARLIDGHARRLMEHIGGSLEDVTQLVWGIGDPRFEADVREESAGHWVQDRGPRVDVLEAAFPHSPLPRLEFIALLDR